MESAFEEADPSAVANLPAEIAHLLEEIQAKDKQLLECRNVINERDNSLQRFIRQNGSHVVNPREEAYSKTVMTNYEQAQTLQDEKLGLSDKAVMLVSGASIISSFFLLRALLVSLMRKEKKKRKIN